MATPTIDAQPTSPPSRAAVDHTNRRWAIGWIIAALGLWAFYKFALDEPAGQVQDLVQQWLPLITVNEALVWVICAIGLNIVVGYAGLLDLGFVAFWAIGGYSAGWFMTTFFYQVNIHFLSAAPADGRSGIHINWWLVLVMAGSICAFFGILIGAPTLRLKSDYLAIVTLGFGEIIPQVFTNGEDINGFNLSNGTKGITPLDPIAGAFPASEGPRPVRPRHEVPALRADRRVLRLRLAADPRGTAGPCVAGHPRGRARRHHDGRAAHALQAVRLRVGAFMGGLGGVVFAIHVNGVFADRFNFSISIILLAMVVLGGMGNVWGVMIGALGLAWINSTVHAAARRDDQRAVRHGDQLPVLQLPDLRQHPRADDAVPPRGPVPGDPQPPDPARAGAHRGRGPAR